MTFKFQICIIFLFFLHSASAFNVCESSGFKKFESGWIRTIKINGGSFLDYKVKIEDVFEEWGSVDDSTAATLARDFAFKAFYKYYLELRPTIYPNTDLVLQKTETFVDNCWFRKTFGFRTELSSLKWTKTD